jgi:hypothetical protein
MELAVLARELTGSELEAGAEPITVVLDSNAEAVTELEAAAEYVAKGTLDVSELRERLLAATVELAP